MAWPDMPPGWQFWQVTGPTEFTAPFAAPPAPLPQQRDDESRFRWEVVTPANQLKTLNELERVLCGSFVRWRRDHAKPDETAAELNVVLPADHPAVLARDSSFAALVEAVTAVRDVLVEAIEARRDPGEPYFAWRRAQEVRMSTYFNASKECSAAQFAAVQAWADRLPPAERHRFWWGDRGSAGGNSPSQPTAGDWQQAERLAAAALRQFGFADAAVTTAGADGGLDVVARFAVAQVKYTTKPVGRPVLQQLQGAAGGRAAVCFAYAGYSAQASAFADEHQIALFTVRLPRTVRPVNRAARTMALKE
ncbi:restriction endonuclease [Geodermatophilus sp. SYSU D01036]